MMKKVYITILSSLVFFGCSEKEDVAPVNQGQPITFSVTTGSEWNTRSLPTASPVVGQLEGESPVPLYLHTSVSPGFESDGEAATRGTMLGANADISSIGLSAYKYGGSKKLQDATPDFFNNINLVRDGSSWSTSTKYYWPADGTKLAFYAYYPYDADRIQVQDVTGPMQILYTQRPDPNTPPTPANQVDFMTAAVTNKNFDNTTAVNIPLQHALTAVKFVMADEEDVITGYIKSVTFTNLLRSAMYTVGTGWNTTSGTMIEPEIKLTFSGQGQYTMNNNQVVTGDDTFLMIPQAFTSNQQKIVIELVAGTKSYTLSYPLQGTAAWEPNTTVEYKVSTRSLNVLNIGSVNFATQWGTIANPLKSAFAENDAIGVYAVDGSGTVINANIKYSYKPDADNGNQLRWVKDDTQRTFFPSDYTFYAYYPYQQTLSGGPTKGSNVLVSEALPTAKQFFSTARTNWTLPADQSALATIQANDMQIGRSTISNATLFNFASMEHAFGLTGTTMNSKTMTKKRTFTVNTVGTTYNSTTFTYTDDQEQVTVTATDVFDTNKPYKKTQNSVNTYYYIVKGSATLNATTTEDRWLNSITAAAADNAYATFSATSRRSRWDYLNAEWNYAYNASKVQSFKAEPYESFPYVLEVWGAKGGTSSALGNGGNGAYVKGTVTLSADEYLYVYCGQQPTTGTGGWNGGGSNLSVLIGGGGATDIALQYNTWNSDQHLYSRIIVAGGGGGAGAQDTSVKNPGGGGGGWVGHDGYGEDVGGGGQLDAGGRTSKGGSTYNNGMNQETRIDGKFGVGGSLSWGSEPLGGGGGGWYGGGAGGGIGINGGGGGGSSYAWTDAASGPGSDGTNRTLSSYYPSSTYKPDAKYKLTNVSVTAGGDGEVANNVGGTGHGKAKITLTRPVN